MKKFLITLVSFFYVVSGFCQTKVLYLKTKETLKFQTWDTLYASVGKDFIILKDSKGNSYRMKPDTDINGSDADIMISEKRYHIHGGSITYICRNGNVLMDKNMKLFFDENSLPLTNLSSFVNHGSHMSHRSHYSSR